MGGCLVHFFVYLYGNFLMLWVASFADSGVLEDSDEAEIVYSNIFKMAIPCSVIMILLVGYMVDNYNSNYIVPIGFLGRACFLFCFQFMTDPRDLISYVVVTGMICFSVYMIMSMESILYKLLPKDIRGALLLLLNIFFNISSAIYNWAGGKKFDSASPAAPFTMISYFDLSFGILAVLLGMYGKFPTAQLKSSKEKPKEAID